MWYSRRTITSYASLLLIISQSSCSLAYPALKNCNTHYRRGVASSLYFVACLTSMPRVVYSCPCPLPQSTVPTVRGTPAYRQSARFWAVTRVLGSHTSRPMVTTFLHFFHLYYSWRSRVHDHRLTMFDFSL